MLTNQNTLPFAAWNQGLSQVDLEYAPEYGALFCNMTPEGLPCFSPKLLQEIKTFQQQLGTFLKRHEDMQAGTPLNYVVHTSGIDGIFNLGGDLGRFVELIRAQDRDSLMAYATACIDVLYANHINFGGDVTSIILLEGTAAGGGLEAALSNDIIIAERGVEMGFPEAIFNLFPGMGAYSFLARRVSPALAERLIKSTRMYKAEEMYEMGLVDELAEPGEGRAVLQRFLKRHSKYANMHRAMKKVKDRVNPVTYEELMDVTTVWVEAALQLPQANIRTMERLVKAQTHRMDKQRDIAAQ